MLSQCFLVRWNGLYLLTKVALPVRAKLFAMVIVYTYACAVPLLLRYVVPGTTHGYVNGSSSRSSRKMKKALRVLYIDNFVSVHEYDCVWLR